MRVLLRSKTTGLYWQASETWTADPTEAFDFMTSPRAIQHMVQHQMRGVDILLWFGNPYLDVLLTGGDSPAPTQESPTGRVLCAGARSKAGGD